jgi:hypothetical protein
VMRQEDSTIQNIPKVLVPKEICSQFANQRKNHVQRMLNWQLKMSKDGLASIRTVSLFLVTFFVD